MSPPKNSLGRRRFLRTIGSASTAIVAAATVPVATSTEAQAYDPGKDERKARYRADSPDVQAFYRTNGYETLRK